METDCRHDAADNIVDSAGFNYDSDYYSDYVPSDLDCDSDPVRLEYVL